MAVEITWAPEAEETFDKNFNYLLNEWGDKQAEKFVQQTDQVIMRLQLFPESYPPGSQSKKYRKARLNKYVVLFYAYYKTKKKTTLVSFWNVKQDPHKLKY